MNAQISWEQANQAHLATALDWLRLRLSQAEPNTSSVATTMKVEPWWRRLHSPSMQSPGMPSPTASAAAQAKPDRAIDTKALAAAHAALQQAEAASPPPALMLLADACGLSAFERQTLLMCAAMEIDSGFGAVCARAHGDTTRPYPTFAMALAFLEEPSWEALAPERPLRALRLLEVGQSGNQPLIAAPLRIDERVAAFLKGLNYLDERLGALCSPLGELATDTATNALPASQQALVDMLAAGARSGRGLLHIHGAAQPERFAVARSLGYALGLSAQALPADALPARGAELDAFIQLWRRESLLLPLLLVIEVPDADTAQEALCSRIQRLASRIHAPVLVVSHEALGGLPPDTLIGEVRRPTPAEQRAAWQRALETAGDDAPALAARMAGQFDLNLPIIAETAAQVLATNAQPAELAPRLWSACAQRARPALRQLAQRIEPRADWDALVLPAHEKEQLRRITEHVRQRGRVYDDFGFRERSHRGLGITALFCGESGTGKTLAAEVLAGELGLALYRIDLSAVVNKYIGETEKNLRRVFDATEDGGAILFFDEADALFGKRSEVRDSHDRYANIEINYLLQRMEAFTGLAILATNMKQALDTAFTRRLRFVINFPFPGATERRAIWASAFPNATPRDGMDLEQLARLGLSGGSIQNVAMNAAFLAAEGGKSVDMPTLMEAVRMEMRKLERSTSGARTALHAVHPSSQ
jgi:SpoVK/Ycf46/Vps4 family AAA+-type ATPase